MISRDVTLSPNFQVRRGSFQQCGHLAFILTNKQKQAEMFPYEEFFRSTVFGAIGGIISVFFLKFLENTGAAWREIRGLGDFNKSRKCPQEHDERFC